MLPLCQGRKEFFVFGTQSHMPPPPERCYSTLGRQQNPQASPPVSGTAPRPLAERSSGIGPFLGEFQNDFSDHEASNARRFFYHSQYPCPRICSTAGPGSPTTQDSCHLQPLHGSPNLSNLGFLPHSQILSQILLP